MRPRPCRPARPPRGRPSRARAHAGSLDAWLVGAWLVGAVLAAAMLMPGTRAAAQTGPERLTGTLLAIESRGTIRIGVRDGSVPFSYRDRDGRPIGFSVDLCREIARDVAARLHRTLLEPQAPPAPGGLRITFVTVPSDQRVRMVAEGAIDLECGSTTATAQRAQEVAFSPVFFIAGTRLAVPADSPITDWRALAGQVVAVSAGTTNETVMRRLAPRATPPFTIRSERSVRAALDAVVAGEAQAAASDDILLAGLIATQRGTTRLRIVGEYLSYEPYAIMLPRDDPAFIDVVRASFVRQAGSGMLRTAYERWFTAELPGGGNLALPMGPELTEIFRALGQPD